MVGAKSHKVLIFALMAGILAFFYMPIISLMVFSFNDSRSLTSWSGFSLQWYEALFKNREMMMAITTTLSIALMSTLTFT